MRYTINPSAFMSAFTVPRAVAQQYLKLATEKQLKVLLCVLSDMHEEILPNTIAATLSYPESEVNDALSFWVQNGILIGENVAAEPPEKKQIVKKDALPSRADVAERGLNDPKVSMLLREAQLKFGRNLKSNESAVLVWMYDDLGFEISVILMLLQYAIAEKKCNITFIQNTAVNWWDNNVQTVADAEKLIAENLVRQLAWSRVCAIFGIERRKPSEKELKTSSLWFDEWKLDDSLLKAAYEVCVDQKSKFIFSYVAKIIELWHQKGCKSADDVKKLSEQKKDTKKSSKNNFAAYDLDLFEKMLNEN